MNDLIEAAEKLHRDLEIASMDEKLFYIDMQLQLERYSWETMRLANELKEIRDFLGGNDV